MSNERIDYSEMDNELHVDAITDGAHAGDVEYNHPSFGLIQASRFYSSHQLEYFGSDVKTHRGGIRLAIQTSNLRRGLSHDWYHGNQTLIEVQMTEVQWASLISNLNQAETPCTIIHEHTRGAVKTAKMPDKFEVYKHEYKNRLDSATSDIKSLVEKLNELGKSTRVNKGDILELTKLAQHVQVELGSNLQYVHNQLCEEVDNVKVDAIKSIEGTILNKVHSMGMQAITEQGATIQLIGNDHE